MHTSDWLQLALYIGLLALITKPMGLYLHRVLDADGRTWLDPILKPLYDYGWVVGLLAAFAVYALVMRVVPGKEVVRQRLAEQPA